MAEFVRAQIFGTTFEITSRYTDLQPVGMGAFGLVWYGRQPLFWISPPRGWFLWPAEQHMG
ncbi:hypothetical protein BO94DRAFT_531797 [Aspergillus sclerotioniger CBS 115572]|uniref:Uncharacterized protein n=1 Tax=Aspergillus sclerotioniger CBS 115572 TaxID=1450535 RepID=A0A317XD28_9EURO|nr:hypothetical protein BO94DRAFT_531797 [Aspergillus sclerotioniger CBS 115572]PWY94858.1 hypothetical protein BO94DRAFT_531797 [Aspergillus sclerotioniger CBS 115572]